jgi:hypothetical protein
VIEVTLSNVSIAVEPGPDETKHIVAYNREGGTIYRLPLGNLNDQIIADLQLTNDELTKKIERELARQQIEIANPQQLLGGDGKKLL